MSTKMFINYMRAYGVEPSEKDVKQFERMAKSYMQQEIEGLEDKLDKANELLAQVYQSGADLNELEESVHDYLIK